LKANGKKSEGRAGIAAAPSLKVTTAVYMQAVGAQEAPAQCNFVRLVRKASIPKPVQLSGSNWIMKQNCDFAELLYFTGFHEGI
jgi:hypothetical protein